MKKIIVLLISMLLVITSTACSKTEPTKDSTTSAEETNVSSSESSDTSVTSESSETVKVESVFDDQTAFPGMIATTVERTGKEAMPTKKTGEIVIGWCPSAMDTYYQRILSGMQEEAAKYTDVKFVIDVQAPSGQSATDDAVRILENWITQKVDVIAVAPSNESSLDPLMRQASEAGIPIFNFNAPKVENPYYVSNIGYNQVDGGRVMAKWIGENYKNKGDVYAGVLVGIADDVYTRMRMQGFNEVIAEYPNIHIVDTKPANWVRADGVTVTEDMLQGNPNMNMLIALYDEMALGGYQAIKAAGNTNIDIVGYENMREVYDLIKDGTQYKATVDTGSKEEGRNIIRAAYNYVVKGEMIPKEIFVTPVAYDITNMNDFPLSEYGVLEN